MCDDELEPLIAFKPRDERYCPKCGSYDLALYYCEASDDGDEFDEEEHLAVNCSECRYHFRMAPKEPRSLTEVVPEAQKTL